MNNKGFTFVEMILAIAMSSFIALGIGYMMESSSENYAGIKRELDLQTDAQIIINTISDRLLEANNVWFDSSTNILTIYHSDGDSTTTDDAQELVWFDDTNHKIYICPSVTEKSTFMGLIGTGSEDLDAKYLLGENVAFFDCSQINPMPVGANGTVTIAVTLELTKRTYKLRNTIELRNQIVPI